MSTITCGVNSVSGDYAGTVAELRAQLSSVLNIPADAKPYVDSELVTDQFVVEDGHELEFVRQAGEKGK